MEKNKLKPQNVTNEFADKKKATQLKSAVKEGVKWGLYAGLLNKEEVSAVKGIIKKGRENSRRRVEALGRKFY